MLRSYRLGSTESNNATPLKWGKTRAPTEPTLLANSSIVVCVTSSALRVDGLARSRRSAMPARSGGGRPPPRRDRPGPPPTVTHPHHISLPKRRSQCSGPASVWMTKEFGSDRPCPPCMPSRDPHHGVHHEALRSRALHHGRRAGVWWFVGDRRATLLRICCATGIIGRWFGLSTISFVGHLADGAAAAVDQDNGKCHKRRRQGFVCRRSWLMINPRSGRELGSLPAAAGRDPVRPLLQPSGRTTQPPDDGMGMHQASKPRGLRTGSRLRTISEIRPSDVARTRTRRRVPSRQVPGIALTPPRSPRAPLPGVPRHGVDGRGCLGT
jgi:hypothetical protein